MNGLKKLITKQITFTMAYDILSGLAKPIFLGTNSPNTNVKYERIIVITTIKMFVTVVCDKNEILTYSAISLAKLSAAKALAKDPDNVIDLDEEENKE